MLSPVESLWKVVRLILDSALECGDRGPAHLVHALVPNPDHLESREGTPTIKLEGEGKLLMSMRDFGRRKALPYSEGGTLLS